MLPALGILLAATALGEAVGMGDQATEVICSLLRSGSQSFSKARHELR